MRTSLTGGFLLLASVIGVAASPDDLAAARGDILPLLAAMQDAANAHDAAKHLSYYAHDASLLFVINDQSIAGWDALLAQQRKWWLDGKSDAHYAMTGDPDFRMPAPGVVIVTYFLTSQRTQADGTPQKTRFGISDVWQRRPEGWRIIYAHESTVNQ